MKKSFLFVIVLLSSIWSWAQTKTTLKGKFSNCTDSVLYLISNSDSDLNDTIKVSSTGEFYYSTTKIKQPVRAHLSNRKQIQVQLFLAPGYQLVLDADVKDYQTATKTLTYSGLGSKTNGYWTATLSKRIPDTVKWVKKDEDTYIKHLLSFKSSDILTKVFSPENKEPYAQYFKESLLLDQKFSKYLSVFGQYAYENNYSWTQIQQMISKFKEDDLLKAFRNDNNLISSSFAYLLTQYPFYMREYKADLDDSLKNETGLATWFVASKLYSRGNYDYLMKSTMDDYLGGAYKLEDLNRMKPYIERVSDRDLYITLTKKLSDRVVATSFLNAGNASPLFNLADTSGNFHQLNAMRGKVVYIDIWASWCGPCKEETPYMRKVYEHYQNDPRIQLISIASYDAKNRKRRYDIIQKDRMDWLQLEDTDDLFAKSYHANAIPRFIIIDKKGNIVDSDATRPSETEKLIKMLDQEINR